MNKQLQDFARSEIKKGLAKLPESNHLLFKRMYSHENLDLPINDVVDKMEYERLDWALQQVERSVNKLG